MLSIIIAPRASLYFYFYFFMKKNNILILGGDGYLGWSLGLAFANRTNFNVVLADNMIKRSWEKEVGARSLVPFKNPAERIAEYKRIFKKNNLSFQKLELLNYEEVVKTIKKYNPTIIINAAQQPSAPFSMMNAKNSAATFSNNIVGHLNVLWAISETNKNIRYIKLGSAGCYCGIDTDFLPLEKTNLKFENKKQTHKVLNSWLPMYATDFYHQSKISDFLINELASDVWNLKIATVQQSTIFGATINENFAKENSSLSTRFNYDAVFGTVMNRFVCQVQADLPITIYGQGNQTTGLISLSDTVNNFINIANTDVSAGQHKVIHNYTLRMSINEIAKKIAEIGKASAIVHMENPRKETNTILSRDVEVDVSVLGSHKDKEKKLNQELSELIEFTGRYKKNINKKIIMPTILWQKQPKPSQKNSTKVKFSLTTQQ